MAGLNRISVAALCVLAVAVVGYANLALGWGAQAALSAGVLAVSVGVLVVVAARSLVIDGRAESRRPLPH